MKINYVYLFLLLNAFFPSLLAQNITNVRSKLEGGILGNNFIEINYQLKCEGWANVGLYISEDGGRTFAGPLKSVFGDVGNKVVPGLNKSIVWDVLKDREMLFGSNIVFRVKAESPFNTLRDPRDGKTYKTVKIGKQVWMAENLTYMPKRGNYWAYDNNNSNVAKYGYLYDWKTACNVCPTGWHLPSEAEWTELTNFVGANSGTKLKAKSGWNSNGNGSDDYGFSALPGGACHSSGIFHNIGEHGFWWGSTEQNAGGNWGRVLNYNSRDANLGYLYVEEWGYSVRCVKDE